MSDHKKFYGEYRRKHGKIYQPPGDGVVIMPGQGDDRVAYVDGKYYHAQRVGRVWLVAGRAGSNLRKLLREVAG